MTGISSTQFYAEPSPTWHPPVLTQLDITLQSEQKVGTLGGTHKGLCQVPGSFLLI